MKPFSAKYGENSFKPAWKVKQKKRLTHLIYIKIKDRWNYPEWREIDRKTKTLPFLYRKRYNIPENDPRFLNITETETIIDFLENQAYENSQKDPGQIELENWMDEIENEKKFKEWQKEQAKLIRSQIKPQEKRKKKVRKFNKINIKCS